jgi:hypothetical protein
MLAVRLSGPFAAVSPDRGNLMAQRSAIDDLRPGDILGFASWHPLGIAINLCTCGIPTVGISHVAIVADHPDAGHPILWESTALLAMPCILAKRCVQGVQAHPIAARLRAECRLTKVWRYPLAEPLDARERRLLSCYLQGMIGRPYDYFGALRSRETFLGWIEQRICREDLHSLFCSELAAAALEAVGRLRSCNASNMNPNRLCRTLVRTDVCGRPIRLQ